MNNSSFIDLSQLRVGMFVHLDVGWMRHPFPVSSFRITSLDQIETLRGLGLERVRYLPEKSDFSPETEIEIEIEKESEKEAQVEIKTNIAAAPEPADIAKTRPLASSSALLTRRLAAQQRRLVNCDQRFSFAVDQYRNLVQAARKDVASARTVSQTLVSDCVDDLQSNGESVIRLVSEGVGEGSAMHAINVMVLCLLLGKAQGLTAPALQELGLAALLHDLGKLPLPAQLAQSSMFRPGAERIGYKDHVGASVALAQNMELSSTVLIAIAQHHEMADGSGFPLGLLGADLSPTGRILALVNHYDGLCNPVNHAESLTPHEALSVLFCRLKAHFDPDTLHAFIRMMGVYPPGSIVQLVNGLYALVVSVNSARPLRPKVIVHDPEIPQEDAPLLDLESLPELGIRRSLKPSQLPRVALDYLSPRQRICYFFERAVDIPRHEGCL